MEYIYNGRKYLLKKLADSFFLIVLDQKDFYIRPFELNESGAYIFEKLAAGISKEEIASQLADNDSANYETIIKDIEEFEDKLKEETDRKI